MKRRGSKLKSSVIEESTPYYKIILIGESAVGKTQFMRRLNGENFEERYSPTYGLDFRVKSNFTEKGKLLNEVQILDIAGDSEDIDEEIKNSFIEDADAFLCLFNLAEQPSLDRVIKKTEEYKRKIGNNLDRKKWYLVGSKKDLDLKREGVPNYLKAKFDSYFEISSKESKNEEFQAIIDKITMELKMSEPNDNEDEDSNDDFEVDFMKNHKDLFDEECIIF